MPYKSEKIHIINSAYDKRIKLTEAQKNEIISLKGSISQRKCAEMFNVSRRTIQFLWDPEKLKRNIQCRQERGGTKQYYNKEKCNEYIKIHRKYKQELYLTGKIS